MDSVQKPAAQPSQDDDPLAGLGNGDLGDAAFEAFLERMDRMLSSIVGEE